jgi:LysM repeat protein
LLEFIFLEIDEKIETILPVTPPSFEVSYGVRVETININKIGDVNIPGHVKFGDIKIDCMFPAKKYPFNQSKAVLNPYYYVNKIRKWINNHTILRFVVSDTAVRRTVFVSDLTYGEKDGTGDVYATITLSHYRKLSTVQTDKTGNITRASEKTRTETNTYVVKNGDTLGAICRKYYGDSSLYSKLATYNGVKNANIISVGLKLKLPGRSLL